MSASTTPRKEPIELPKLTSKVLACQKGRYSKKKLLEEVALLVYEIPVKYFRLSQDENSEFFISVFRTLPNLIKEFTYRKVPFESCLFKLIELRLSRTLKNNKKTDIRHHIVSHVIRKDVISTQRHAPSFEATMVEDISAVYAPLPKYKQALELDSCGVMPESSGNKKGLLCLTLLAADELSVPQLTELLYMCGCPKDKFFLWLRELKNLQTRKIEHLNHLRTVRNKVYILLLEHQTFLQYAVDSEKQEELQGKIARYEERLKFLQQRIARYTITPSQREISVVTGIPQGTIGAAIANGKSLLTKIADGQAHEP